MRSYDRSPDMMRPVSMDRGVQVHAEGSCLIKFGQTHVLCSASFEDKPPSWLRGTGKGWITAEYGMLPRSTHSRSRREASAGKQSGRTMEIQRLIGRALRAVVDLSKLPDLQITLDCDVLQADGGTRTASITGAFVALHDCVQWMLKNGHISSNPIRDHVAAVSCGIHKGNVILDLDYLEDSSAETDANFVLTGSGQLIEVQATAEEKPFGVDDLSAMLSLAQKGTQHLIQLQKIALS